MSNQDRKLSLADILPLTGEMLTEELDSVDNELPGFIQEARRLAEERGVPAMEILDAETREQLQHAEYPTHPCLLPFEVEQLARGDTLPVERQEHIDTCVHCHALVGASKATDDGLQRVLSEVRQGGSVCQLVENG